MNKPKNNGEKSQKKKTLKNLKLTTGLLSILSLASCSDGNDQAIVIERNGDNKIYHYNGFDIKMPKKGQREIILFSDSIKLRIPPSPRKNVVLELIDKDGNVRSSSRCTDYIIRKGTIKSDSKKTK